MIITQDFSRDFDLLTAGLRRGYDGPPYALSRFADGEAGIMRGRGHKAKSDGWEWPAGEGYETCGRYQLPWLLLESLTCELPGWHLGITAEEHHPKDHRYLNGIADEVCGVPESRRTFAEIFLFANWTRFRELDLSHCCIVGPGGDIDVPRDAVSLLLNPSGGWPWQRAMDALLKVRDRPILVAAGPLANVIIHEYWQQALAMPESQRTTIIDVGSAISHILHPRRRIRAFQKKGNERANWRPRWKV